MSATKVGLTRDPRSYVRLEPGYPDYEWRWVPSVILTRDLLAMLITLVATVAAVVAAWKFTDRLPWVPLAVLVAPIVWTLVLRWTTRLFKITPEEARGLPHDPVECDACAGGFEHPKFATMWEPDPLTVAQENVALARVHLATAELALTQAALDKETTR